MTKTKPKTTRKPKAPLAISAQQARTLWLAAQKLTEPEPFGAGPDAVKAAIEHLGYVQIDTINVIERCHHHILFNRIPAYRRANLHHAQSVEKSVFEYWTHALSYIPARDFRFFVAEMKGHRNKPSSWYAGVSTRDINRIVRRVRDEGALTISDIKDDAPVDKDHPWASRKPSKRLLEAAFYNGLLVVARREGMLKTYELTTRHFGWEGLPKAASTSETARYLLDRALNAQGIVSLDSICYLAAKAKPAVTALIEKDVRARRLVPIVLEGAEKIPHWAKPECLEAEPPAPSLTHILSPFDPLVIQRKRTGLFFGYDHLFEAYVPKEKRKFGYFTLPVLAGSEIVAALDLKADRQAKKLLVQAWHWVGKGNAEDHKAAIESALDRFARFQFAG